MVKAVLILYLPSENAAERISAAEAARMPRNAPANTPSCGTRRSRIVATTISTNAEIVAPKPANEHAERTRRVPPHERSTIERNDAGKGLGERSIFEKFLLGHQGVLFHHVLFDHGEHGKAARERERTRLKKDDEQVPQGFDFRLFLFRFFQRRLFRDDFFLSVFRHV